MLTLLRRNMNDGQMNDHHELNINFDADIKMIMMRRNDDENG